MEEKETEIEQNKDESQKTRNELKVSDIVNLPVEERRKTFTDLLTETSRKR